ncbi:MAG: ATP-binding protein [Deltaproteobacteria bacterium]|nr:ATP-binding protein [Deltaproteobacteria bacterium]
MNKTPYRMSAEIMSDRVAWALAALVGLLNEGRTSGWIDGAPVQTGPSHAVLRAVIAERIAETPNDQRLTPLEWMSARLGLHSTELDALWLLACAELEPSVARLVQVFGSPGCPDLSVQILQRLVPIESDRLASLQLLGLIELNVDARVPQHRRPIRINDRVLEIVRGELRLDPELDGIAELRGRDDRGEPERTIVTALASDPAPVVIAIGPEGAGRATILGRAAGERGFGTLRVKVAALASDEPTRERQLRAAIREAYLFELVPMFIDVDAATRTSIERATHGFSGPVLVTTREAIPWRDRPMVTHVVERPERETRAEIWRARLAGASEDVIAKAADGYSLRPGAIVAAARNATATGRVTIEAVHEGVRARIGDELGTLATRIDWRQTWEDLVLPEDQFEQILELVARVRHRAMVLDTWGFGAKIGKGHGVTALFSGPPGTGKTMVAGLVAKELGLDLYQVDLSKIVSKYIGETEKQLASLFDAAEAGHAILLFDEADSLFAKRTEVKSSNDRYANLEVNFLLQRMETFTGISLLTTNHETALDDAFRRRIAMHVRFPMPEETQREQLWRAMLPEKAPVTGPLELRKLAREFEMSGGYIKNAVLRAAYLAADEGSAIGNKHLSRSARAEYEAMGKVAFQLAG